MEIKNYGPSDIEIHIKDKGMVLREKSLIALSTNDRKVLAIGADAEKMALEDAMYQSGERKVLISESSPERFWADVMASDDKRCSSYDLFIVIIPEMN